MSRRDQQSKAYRFLAQYHLKKGHMEDAYNFAQKCTEFAESKAEGKALLKEIARRKRSSSERNPISSKPLFSTSIFSQSGQNLIVESN